MLPEPKSYGFRRMFSAIDGVTYPFVHMKKEVDEEDDKLHADTIPCFGLSTSVGKLQLRALR